MRAWTVLLLGGASGVGKTSLSYPLARRLEVNLTEIDDIQVALEAITTPEQQPLLHFWRTHLDEFHAWDDEQRLAHFVEVSRTVFQPGLEAVVANHLETNTPVVLEGDFILPELAKWTMFGDQANAGRVRALFVHEADEGQIAANFATRDGVAQPERAHGSALVDRWLRDECARCGVPAIGARPWNTLLERALELVA